MKIYLAREICLALLSGLDNGPTRARVHSIFSGALNLSYSGRIITLLSAEKRLVPYSAGLRNAADFKRLNIAKGACVDISHSGINILSADVAFSFESAAPVDLSLRPAQRGTSGGGFAQRLAVLRDFLSAHGNPAGMAPVACREMNANVFSASISGKVLEFCERFETGDPASLKASASGMVGCGPGLTPASDDFIHGLLAVYLAGVAFGEAYSETLTRARLVAEAAVEKTTDISVNMLYNCAEGLLPADLLQLILCLFSGCETLELERAAQEVLQIGATSGSDTLAGVCFAGRRVAAYTDSL